MNNLKHRVLTFSSSIKLDDKKPYQAPQLDTIDPNANISDILSINHISID